MFTGIVANKARIQHIQLAQTSAALEIEAIHSDLVPGESIAINGVCLTLTGACKGNMAFDVSSETLHRTCLGTLNPGSWVNVERALLASDRLGGHYVSGHVDCQARLVHVQQAGAYLEMRLGDFSSEDALLYLLPKGSITVDGVSLTINAVENGTVSLLLVPHTLAQTALGALSVGSRVNIEFDYITRIVAHQLTVSGYLQNEVKL